MECKKKIFLKIESIFEIFGAPFLIFQIEEKLIVRKLLEQKLKVIKKTSWNKIVD